MTDSTARAGTSPQLRRYLALAILVGFAGLCYLGLRIRFSRDDFWFLARTMGLAVDEARGPAANLFRPLSTDLYFGVLYRLFGLRPLPYHLVNLALIAAGIALVILVGRRLLGRPLPAMWAALLFLMAPLNFRLHFWISCVQDIMMIDLSLLAALCFLIARAQEGQDLPPLRRWMPRVLGPLFFALALLAKESALWLPAWLLLLDLAPRDRAGFRKLLPRHLAYLAVLGLFLILRVGLFSWPSQYHHARQEMPALLRGLSYLREVVLPLLPVPNARSPLWGLGVLILAPALLWRAGRRRDPDFFPALAGIAWFGLGVALFIYPVARFHPYFISFASIGFFWAAGLAADRTVGGLPARWRVPAAALTAAVMVLLGWRRMDPLESKDHIFKAGLETGALHEAFRQLHPSLPANARVLLVSELAGEGEPWTIGLPVLYRQDLEVVTRAAENFREGKHGQWKVPDDGYDYTGLLFFTWDDLTLTEYSLAPGTSALRQIRAATVPKPY